MPSRYAQWYPEFRRPGITNGRAWRRNLNNYRNQVGRQGWIQGYRANTYDRQQQGRTFPYAAALAFAPTVARAYPFVKARVAQMAGNAYRGFKNAFRGGGRPPAKGKYMHASSGRTMVSRRKRRRKFKKQPFTKKQWWKILKAVQTQTSPKLLSKTIVSGVIIFAENKVAYKDFSIGNPSEYDALLAKYIQVEDIGAGDVENPIDLTGFKQTKVQILRAMRVIILANNHHVPVILDMWTLKPKTDGTLGPTTWIASGLDDVAGSDAGWETSTLWYPQHSPVINRQYWFYGHERVTLQPGDQIVRKIFALRHLHSADEFDLHSATRRMKTTRFLLIRLQGVVGRAADGLTSGYMDGNIGFTDAKHYTFKILHSGQIKRWNMTETLATTLTKTVAEDPADETEP